MFAYLLIASTLILPAWAGDGSTLNGVYVDQNPAYCAMELEGYKDMVIATFTNNPITGKKCIQPGVVSVFDCTAPGDWCHIVQQPGHCARARIMPLASGNFLFANPCSGTTFKLIKVQ